MRLTTRTNLAMRTLMVCAVNDGRIVRKADVAAKCNASENHLAQVVNLLGRLGYIETLRGRGGGLRLGRPAAQISIGAVCRSFEGDVPFTECFDAGINTCPIAPCCTLKGVIQGALDAFYSHLDRVSLADLVADNTGLGRILGLDKAPRPSSRVA